ncbi:hypothetical protein AAM31_004404 [Salmonella enterica subsp. enterica]|nr:hypothetical protein [Salmonella enterica subsp. enterica]
MESITVQLKTIYPGVAEVYVNEAKAGYICKNRTENSAELPESIVLNDGSDLGDYDCVNCATKALVKHHCGDDCNYLTPGEALLSIISALALRSSKKILH